MIVIVILLTLIIVGLMELNKNTIWGKILAIAVSAEFIFVWHRLFQTAPTAQKLLAWLVYIACLAMVFYITMGQVKRHPAVPEIPAGRRSRRG